MGTCGRKSWEADFRFQEVPWLRRRCQEGTRRTALSAPVRCLPEAKRPSSTPVRWSWVFSSGGSSGGSVCRPRENRDVGLQHGKHGAVPRPRSSSDRCASTVSDRDLRRPKSLPSALQPALPAVAYLSVRELRIPEHTLLQLPLGGSGGRPSDSEPGAFCLFEPTRHRPMQSHPQGAIVHP